MSIDPSTSHIYTDFQGLSRLRTEARKGSPDSLRVVAKQFEAYMVQQLLKSGRAASLGTGVMDSQQSQFYQELYDQQIALSATESKGLGIADMLVEQIERRQAKTGGDTAERSAEKTGRSKTLPMASANPHDIHATSSGSGLAATAVHPSAPVSVGAAAAGKNANPRFEGPREFVRELMPQARRVAAELDVDPRLLLAQAALETGWGKSIIRSDDGTSSHNLFGIKADSRWDGATARVQSLEYENGVMVKRRSSFRAYASFQDSFRDYVHFLHVNPRYGEALSRTNDPRAFAQALQQAGYATDPAYAEKILAIYDMDALSVNQS